MSKETLDTGPFNDLSPVERRKKLAEERKKASELVLQDSNQEVIRQLYSCRDRIVALVGGRRMTQATEDSLVSIRQKIDLWEKPIFPSKFPKIYRGEAEGSRGRSKSIFRHS